MDRHLREITNCEVCGNQQLRPVLNLGAHPMCDDLVEIGDPRECESFPIEILFCDQCTTAHQRYQIPKQDLFPTTYHYRSRHTADVLSGMQQLVRSCAEVLGGLEGKAVLDIGCNDGSLLSFFQRAGTAKTFGIEPTGAASDAKAQGHVVLNDFLTEDVATDFVSRFGHPDIITFTNVFAHIEDLPAVIRSLLILAHEGTTIVVENHYLGAVIAGRQFDTFYHEHPRTYSFRSFATIAEGLDRRVIHLEFPARYGGNIRVMMGRSSEDGVLPRYHDVEERERTFGARLEAMGRDIETWKKSKTAKIEAAVRAHGKLVAKAFPGRAAIPIKLLGLDESVISAVYEKPASAKLGHYVPGTRIPIRSDDELDLSAAAGPIVNMAWHISGEIRPYMRERGYKGDLIDIISADDFDPT